MTDPQPDIPIEYPTKKEAVYQYSKVRQELWHDLYTGFKNGGWKSVILGFIGLLLIIFLFQNAQSLSVTPEVMIFLGALGCFIASIVVWILERKDKARIAVFEIAGKKTVRSVKIDPHDPEDTIKYDAIEGKMTSISIWDYPDSLIKTGNKYDETYRGLQLVQCFSEYDRNTRRNTYVGSIRVHKWYVQGDPIPGLASVVLARAVSKKFEKISKKYDAYIEKIKTQKPSTKREQILELDKKFEMGKTILIHASEEMESILRRSPVKFDLDSFAKYTKRFLIGVALAEDYHNVKRLEMQADPTAFVSSNLVKLAEDATEAIAKGMALNTASTWMINNAFMEAMAAFAKRLNVGAKDIQEFDKALSKPRELTVEPVDEKKGGIVVGEK